MNNAQKQLVLGTLLGDGYMFVPMGSYGRRLANPRLKVGHCIKQESLVRAKRAVMGEFVGSEPRTEVNGGWGTTRLVFETLTHPEFSPIYALCYPGGRKRVSREWLDMLSPEGMAWWFMDDGSHQSAGVNISTDGFSLAEHFIMAQWFSDQWGITAKLQRTKNEMHCLRFSKTDAHKLSTLIGPHVIPEMKYKLYLAASVNCAECGASFIPRKLGAAVCYRDECQRAAESRRGRATYLRNRDRILAGLRLKRSSSAKPTSTSTT